MTGRKEFTYPVGGSGDSPVSTSATGSFETDNYDEGGVINITAYPTTIDPPETIQELVWFQIGNGIELEIVTKSGTVISGVKPKGATAALNHLSMDSVKFTDPGATEAETHGMWVGE